MAKEIVVWEADRPDDDMLMTTAEGGLDYIISRARDLERVIQEHYGQEDVDQAARLRTAAEELEAEIADAKRRYIARFVTRVSDHW